ncbi:hypothetical protein HAX54_035065 [Datura stramonium]|uniref:Uncharacterized protein n=1 Tax=Datura stramonium TaxID=4076 RepID=A0ABS8VG27_DATST|nr:hypothetical protein [Datura stramonium]
MVNFRDYTSPSSKLKYLIVQKVLKLRDIREERQVVFEGESCHIPGIVGSGAEDTLGEVGSFGHADIYDAVYASLFTYDRNSYMYKNFAAWYPKINTILTSVEYWWMHLESISTKISEVAPQDVATMQPKIGNSSTSWSCYRLDLQSRGPRSSNKSGDVDLVVLEIPDSVDSPSTTLTVSFKESGVDCDSSLKEEVQVILEEMDGKDVDVSPLMRLVKFLSLLIYDRPRSTLHDKDMEGLQEKRLSIAAGERLSNAMFEEHEKIRKKFLLFVNL